jgi:predicted acylesterase/phospholipase RssA
MSNLWREAADLVIEPNVAGFGYDDFKRADELMHVGEAAMRNALPEVRKWLETPAEQTYPAVERRGAPRVAPMAAD